MLEYFLIGSGFALAAGVQPGPLQAFLFSKVTQKGWKHTLPASFAPLISDGPIALVVLLILNRFPKSVSNYLQAAGGILLIYFAISIFLQLKTNNVEKEQSKKKEPHTIWQAVLVNLLNPNPYIGWSLVLGPAAIKAWNTNPTDGVILIASFYLTMVTTLAITIVLFGTTSFLSEKGRRVLFALSGILLLAIGIYQLTSGVFSII